jgi:hypothetical protein
VHEVSRAHGVRLGGGLHARWDSARKLVSGGTAAEHLDGPQGRERSSHSNHHAPVPELWVFRIVCNPAKPEWCLGLREEFEPTAISCCADWAGGPPDSTWSCSPISGEVISIRHFAELREICSKGRPLRKSMRYDSYAAQSGEMFSGVPENCVA